MSAEWLQAAQAVADVLTRENQALAAMDLRRATALLGEKQRACATLETVQARHALSASLHDPQVLALARRLDSLARDNCAWLERGLAAQGRVIALVVAAAKQVRHDKAPAQGRYTARGGRPPAPIGAVALSARA
jgi:hypothetical protein